MLRRVRVDTGQEEYPVTIASEPDLPDVSDIEVADSIWQRYLAAVAELSAVKALLEDLAAVDYERRRCSSHHGEIRCSGIEGHPGKHWGWPSTRLDNRGKPLWQSWEDSKQ